MNTVNQNGPEWGPPRHDDAFLRKHPPMDLKQRAKIFAPFDALRGFSAAIIARETVYEPFREKSEDGKAELDRKLAELQPLVSNSRIARENRVMVAVTYFQRTDGGLGQYRTQTGMLKRIDSGRLLLDDCPIDLDDIDDIRRILTGE